MSRCIRKALLTCIFCAWWIPAWAEIPLARALASAAHSADPKVIRLAVAAANCAGTRGEPAAERLAVIDYSRPSTVPRLWVFDLSRRKLLYQELVAHGRNSGDIYASRFSNAPESLASSLGLFRTEDTYDGHNGYSLRLSGLEPGINDQAEARAIVMHGAPYVTPGFIKTTGHLGRSLGCPAVRPEIAHALIDTLKGGQYVFAYYPDRKWLESSKFLSCRSTAPGMTAGASQELAAIAR